jgi:mercuric ion transport protein
MIRAARLVYIGLAWAFLASVIVQVFLVGTALFAGSGFQPHIWFAAVVHAIPLLMLAAGALGRVGRRRLGLAALAFVVISVQAMLPLLRPTVPLLAALHPVGALAIFWLAVMAVRSVPGYAQRSEVRARQAEPAASPARGS